jgi:sulfoacetaldehyde dehydrogenase
VAFLVNEEQKQKLKETLWDEEGHLNTAIVAQPAEKIADMANIEIPEGTGFYIVPETGWGERISFFWRKTISNNGIIQSK